MKQILNTLYVMTQGSYLHLDHETLKVEFEKTTRLQVPVHHLGAVVIFGDVMVSPGAMHKCAEDGRALVLLDRNGRFKARLVGPASGNVLLRKAQHEMLACPGKLISLAKNIVAGKIKNSRQVIMRGAREAKSEDEEKILKDAAKKLDSSIASLKTQDNPDAVRGVEGDAARSYFDSFDCMIKKEKTVFRMEGRNRRPPLDPINALLSFLYALLLNDCVAGLEGVGLDPQVGFFHALRPGRPALALDIMEELRSIMADRLVLSLVNLGQVSKKHFDYRPGGAVLLNDDGRKEVVSAWQKRKQEEIFHPTVEQNIPFGLIPHTQARLLARYVRGDVEEYIPFIYR